MYEFWRSHEPQICNFCQKKFWHRFTKYITLKSIFVNILSLAIVRISLIISFILNKSLVSLHFGLSEAIGRDHQANWWWWFPCSLPIPNAHYYLIESLRHTVFEQFRIPCDLGIYYLPYWPKEIGYLEHNWHCLGINNWCWDKIRHIPPPHHGLRLETLWAVDKKFCD